jgi:hypothetical protein
MRFKLDENLPTEILEDLRVMGHNAESVVGEGLGGSPDALLMETVKHESRVFLTLDKGVADIREYPPELHHGIVLFRPPTSGRGAVLAFARLHLQAILNADLDGHLLVVTDRSIRIR